MSAILDDREVVRQVVQNHLTDDGAVIFGFPNCRYVDGEIEYGTRMKNFTQPELGLLIKDVAFFRASQVAEDTRIAPRASAKVQERFQPDPKGSVHIEVWHGLTDQVPRDQPMDELLIAADLPLSKLPITIKVPK